MSATEVDENNPEEEEVVPSIENIAVKSYRERPIPPGSVRELYVHVGWRRPGSEEVDVTIASRHILRVP